MSAHNHGMVLVESKTMFVIMAGDFQTSSSTEALPAPHHDPCFRAAAAANRSAYRPAANEPHIQSNLERELIPYLAIGGRTKSSQQPHVWRHINGLTRLGIDWAMQGPRHLTADFDTWHRVVCECNSPRGRQVWIVC